MQKKSLMMMALFIGLALVFTGCAGGVTGFLPSSGEGLLPGDVVSVELTNLNGEPVRELGPAEVEAIVAALNQAKEDESPYIMMIAGYTMTITLTEGEIRLTSYGSETNVVATFVTGENTTTKHLVCPQIAQILTEDLGK
ncbi:MAG TPA: hypothetical protein GXX34_02370 [Clostridia bacterium]|nr:hypothetical protein [Clostridia bacterium]